MGRPQRCRRPAKWSDRSNHEQIIPKPCRSAARGSCSGSDLASEWRPIFAERDSGDPERDFAAMMIPHHQGAIDMAKVQLQFGRDPVLRRLAQAIIVEQQQEIEVMRRELSRLPPSPSERLASPPTPMHSHSVTKEQ